MVNRDEKIIEPGSLRWLGQNYNGLYPHETVVAGIGIKDISEAINLPCYKFKNLNIENIFIAHDSKGIFYIYVNPRYKNYRNSYREIVGDVPYKFHVDHVLSKSLAVYWGYNYVLLCVIPGKVNSKHGYIESKKAAFISMKIPKVCYADERVFHKILSRNPTARQDYDKIKGGYIPTALTNYGLSLKQKGIWNSAFAFDTIDMKALISRTTKIEF